MIHTFQNLEDFEFNSRFRNSSTLRSLKHVINIIMWIRDTGCYNWLSKHNGLIDYANKAVRLTTSSGKELEYVAENLFTDKAASNQIVLNRLDAASTLDIRTVSKFLDVFPEELPDMPPDHEIEFVIKLIPGTAPIFKRPY
jgi:hypothetical protein